MTTHKKALEAAYREAATRCLGRDRDIEENVDAILRAYLSALLPEDAALLVERLNVYRLTGDLELGIAIDEAASLIQSQAARIVGLEAGLERLTQTNPQPVAHDYESARALLNGERKG